MNTIEYYGWTVLKDDNRYGPAMQNNINFTNEGYEQLDDVLENHVNNRNCVFEIGVNYGFTTKYLSEKFKLIHTFDFNNDVMECFKINMKKFKCENIIMHEYGLGNENTQVATNDIFPHGRGTIANHIDMKGTEKKYLIKRLDDLSLNDPDLIIIDTEGFELFVLQGGIKIISKVKPPMIIEFHKKKLTEKFFNYQWSDTEKLLESLNYRYIKNITKNDRLYVAS